MNTSPHIDVAEPGRIAAIMAEHPLPAVSGWLDRTVNLTSKTAGTNRLLRTVLLATLCLAGATGGWAAEPAPQAGLAYEFFGDADLKRPSGAGGAPDITPMDKGGSDWSVRFAGILTPPADGEQP